MSVLLSAKEIVERSLRQIGSYSINDDAARTEEMNEGLFWLDLIMSQLAGTEHINFLSNETVSLSLSADMQSFNLQTALVQVWPKDGMAFPLNAYLINGSTRTEIELITKKRFDELEEETGLPQYIYIDRTNNPILNVWPVPSTGDLTLELTFQKFSPTFEAKTNIDTGLKPSWQRWAIYALSAEIGNGPVRKVPRSELNDYRAIAEATLQKLQAFDRSFDNGEPVMPYYG